MQRRTGSAKYTRLRDYDYNGDEDSSDDNTVAKASGSKNKNKSDFLPGQFQCFDDKRVPWKAILLAGLLFVMGSVLLAAGCLIHTGHVDNDTVGHFAKVWRAHYYIFPPHFGLRLGICLHMTMRSGGGAGKILI